MAKPGYTIRRAAASDIEAIAALVKEFSSLGHILPRAATDIKNTIHDWRIALLGDQLIGCGSLRPYSESLAEVRSLVVAEGARGNGLGGELLSALVEEAKGRDFETLFALTRAVPFFERHGFRVGRRVQFPRKVWQDCLTCPLFLRCSETTVVLGLSSGGLDRRIPGSAQEKGVAHVQ